MVQGNSYRHSSKELLPISTALDPSGGFPVSFVFEGSNLLARRSWGMAGGDATLQAYVDHTDARLNAQGNGKIIVDVDFQHTLAPMGRHELMWGLGARYGRVDFARTRRPSPSRIRSRIPDRQRLRAGRDQPGAANLDAHPRFALRAFDALRFRAQPTARLMWTPTTDDSLWLNWSRACAHAVHRRGCANVVLGAQPLPPTSPFPALVLRSLPAPI
jgi:hypothetical protein